MRAKFILAAAVLPLLAACAGNGIYGGGIGASEGAYANPLQTPVWARVPQTVVVTSGIPGESGVSSVSSALSGGGGGGGGAGGGGGGGSGPGGR